MARPATAAVRLLTGEREPVRLATTANITLYGLQTIDGVLTEVGDRVLVKDQTDGLQNGIYTASAGTWYRAADARTARTMQKGTTVHVQEGTVSAAFTFAFQTLDPVIGADDIVVTFYTSDNLVGDAVAAMEAAGASIVADVEDAKTAAESAAGANLANADSRAAAILTTIPAPVNYVRTAGYAATGDAGGALYKKVVAEPTHAGKFQSSDGAWWELAERAITLEMFGGVADGTIVGSTVSGTDNLAAINAAMAYGLVNVSSVYGAVATIQLGRGAYYCSAPIKIKRNIRIVGASGGSAGNASTGSHLLFPTNTVGIYVFSYNSIDPDTGLAVGTDAGGATLEYFSLMSVAGTDRTKHAICMRARAICKDLRILNFSGDGYNISSSGSIGGNINNWYIQGGRVVGCQNGIFTSGGDSNAGVAVHVDCSSNRQAGVLDRSFLGNLYLGSHENGNGTLAQASDGVNRYRANPTVALLDDPTPLRTTAPGTNPAIWELISAGGANTLYPLWVSGNEYVVGGQKISTNSNARTAFVGGYSEPGWPADYIIHPATILGGCNTANIHANSTAAYFNAGTWSNVVSFNGSAAAITAGVGGTGEPVTLHNDGSASSTRGVGLGMYAGYAADGVTPKKAARFSGVSAGAAGTSSSAVIEITDTANAWVEAMRWRGASLEAHPATDNTWSLGRLANRWLKGWFGNISVFPTASVTPANNGEVTFQLTSDTSLTFKVKGSDGVVRSGSIVLA